MRNKNLSTVTWTSPIRINRHNHHYTRIVEGYGGLLRALEGCGGGGWGEAVEGCILVITSNYMKVSQGPQTILISLLHYY